MKFVGDKIQFLSLNTAESTFFLELPQFHRASIGLFPGTKVYLTPIKNRRDLVITSISPENWGDIWEVKVALKDVPGAVKSILDTLARFQVNVLIQEGLSDVSRNGREIHYLYLIVDLSDYTSDIDGKTDDRNHVGMPRYRPNYLINVIVQKAFDVICTTPDETDWDISFERLEFFYQNKECRTLAKETNLVGNKISLPQKMVLETFYNGNTGISPACHITSDTEQKFIKVSFLEEDLKYALLKVEHQDRLGAISELTAALSNHNINIVNSYSRMFDMNEKAIWYSFLKLPNNITQSKVSELFTAIEVIKSVISFEIIDTHALNFSVQRSLNNLPLEKFKTKTSISNSHHHVDTTKLEDFRENLEGLRVKPFYANKGWEHRSNSVFVAIPFDETSEKIYNKFLRQTIAQNNFQPVKINEILSASPNDNINDMIFKAIAESEFVVADVTKHNANVLYEVGIAHAIGKQVIIISSEDGKEKYLFDINQKPHIHYDIFEMDVFVDKFDKAIKAVSSGVEINS